MTNKLYLKMNFENLIQKIQKLISCEINSQNVPSVDKKF
jgi:hypothetical protein